MRYYGLKKKQQKEEFLYRFAKIRAKLNSLLPGKHHHFWKNNYQYIFGEATHIRNRDNSLPEERSFYLNSFIVADLIRREDIPKLQKGIRQLLKKYRSGRFLSFQHDGLDEICNKIEQMDSTLSMWYTQIDCGVFEFSNHPLRTTIDYFNVRICNINSSFLSLEFEIHLSKSKIEQLNNLIQKNYINKRGYAYPTLTAKSKEGGAFETYSVIHYNDDALKADRIYEYLGIIEWDFMEAMSQLFPFVFHKRNIMPPRIELYYTDIDYHEDWQAFWSSIGIECYNGQFIDERHKMFFSCSLSGRYEKSLRNNRLLYIVKDDGIDVGKLESVKDDVYLHMKEYAIDYFTILFLEMLTDEAAKKVVAFKQKLDSIKLKKNKILDLLKLKYYFSLITDDYFRYLRDENVEKAEKELSEVYKDNELILEKIQRPFLISYKSFCNSTKLEAERVQTDIEILLKEFEEKKQILQNLSDYKNAKYITLLNSCMFIISALTLFFVIFPEKATALALLLAKLKNIIGDIIKNI